MTVRLYMSGEVGTGVKSINDYVVTKIADYIDEYTGCRWLITQYKNLNSSRRLHLSKKVKRVIDEFECEGCGCVILSNFFIEFYRYCHTCKIVYCHYAEDLQCLCLKEHKCAEKYLISCGGCGKCYCEKCCEGQPQMIQCDHKCYSY